MINIPDILSENRRRVAELFSPYDPVKGEGSPLKRVAFVLDNHTTHYIPVWMLEVRWVADIVNAGGLAQWGSKTINRELTKDEFVEAYQKYVEIRCKYDFEYWAATQAHIMDKETGDETLFVLNKPQRVVLKQLMDDIYAGVPLRIVVLKSRQWGSSTFFQVFMLWIQTFWQTGWSSVVCADLKDKAKHIRGMFTYLAQRHSSTIASITLKPYQQSQEHKEYVERNCMIGVGSVENPLAFNAYSFYMAQLCISRGTLIPIADGFLKPIEEVCVGDRVITHTGAVTTVKNVCKTEINEFNGDGVGVKITPYFSAGEMFTPNHKVLTNRGLIEAGSIRKTDWVILPIRKITNGIQSIQLPTFTPRPNNRAGRVSAESGKVIQINKEVGFAFGYYLAEGSLHYSKAGANCITLTRHDKEFQYGDRAAAALSEFISSHKRKKIKNTLTTNENLYCTILARWVESELGTKNKKRIPDWFFDCGNEFLSGVLDGYLSGDGSKNNNHYSPGVILAAISVTTVSSSLAMQIRDVALSLGHGFGAVDMRDAGNYYGRNCQKRYTVRWSGKAARSIRRSLGWGVPNNGHAYSEKYRVIGDYVYVKVKSINEVFLTDVYDIEVDHQDHTFRTMYMAVSNSEIGLWKKTTLTNPKELVQSISSVVPHLPFTLIVKESTARGVGTLFHDEWIKAESGTSGYRAVFIPWFYDARNYREIKDLEQFVKTMTPDDWGRWAKGATLQGIYWYNEHKRKENFDDVSMGENFPTDPQEAFMSSGRRAFRAADVLRARKTCCDPIFVGDIYGASMKGKEALKDIKLEKKTDGELRVWIMPPKEPVVSNRFAIAVDIGGRTAGADWSIIKVFDRMYQHEGGVPEVAAVWVGHGDQDHVSWKAAQLGMIYNKALIAVEVNSLDTDEDSEGDHSMTVLDEIAEDYDNLYARVDPEKVRLGAPVLYGFHNNRKTRPMIIDALNAGLRDQSYIERDSRACDEMDWFVMSSKGKYEAQEGKHDDHVISTAIGVWLCNSYMDVPKVINKEGKRKSGRAVSEATF